MPYDMGHPEDMPEHVQEMSSDDMKKWVAIFNNVYRTCMEKKGNEKECEKMAFAVSNDKVKGKEEKKSMGGQGQQTPGYWLFDAQGKAQGYWLFDAQGQSQGYWLFDAQGQSQGQQSSSGQGYWLFDAQKQPKGYWLFDAQGQAQTQQPVATIPGRLNAQGKGYWLFDAQGQPKGYWLFDAQRQAPKVSESQAPGYWLFDAQGQAQGYWLFDAQGGQGQQTPGYWLFDAQGQTRGQGYWLFDSQGGMTPQESGYWLFDAQGNGYWLFDARGQDIEKAVAVTKKEADGEHPASHYLVVENKYKPTTWHLRVKDVDGSIDRRLLGAAWAALHVGFRGNKYEGPQKEEAIAKLKKLYESEKMTLPSEKSISLDDDFVPTDYFTSFIRYSSQDGTVKSLGNNRVGAYANLWGDEEKKDLTGEWFDKETKDLDLIFKAVGKLPYLYHHGLDDKVKTRVIGVIDTLEYDDVGLWYEAQLKMADEYDTHVLRLIRDGKLKSSTQTLASGRQVSKSGHIERWPIVEISATPTPAEPRMVSVDELKSVYQAVSLDFGNVEKALNGTDGNGQGKQGDEKSRLQGWLLMEQEMLSVEEMFSI